VILSAAGYRSGPLFLASGTSLVVPEGASLAANDDPNVYVRPDGGLFAFINAVDASDLTLEGGGVIDGDGATWWTRFRQEQQTGQAASPRPRLVAFDRCANVRIHGLQFRNSPSFHLVFRSCTDVEVDGVAILAPPDSPNTDGIDPMASRSVRVVNSTIDTGDDNIAIKSGTVDSGHPGAASSDISIDRCTFLHGHGVSIGSETNGGVQHVLVSNSTFHGTENGIRIKTNRDSGGPISHIRYRDLLMDGVQHPIAFAAYYPTIPSVGDEIQRPVSGTTPRISDVRVSHLEATDVTSAGWIIGLPEQPFERIHLSHVSISGEVGLQIRNASVSVK
jgi:polygalacturonase